MWFGTQDGLIRYDGYNYKAYRPEPGQKSSLANGYINTICEDKSGRYIWVGTRAGISRYEKSTGLFENYNPERKALYVVNTLHADKDGKIWAGTNRGLLAFQPSDWAKRNNAGFGAISGPGADSLVKNGIYHIAEGQGILFFSGLYKVWQKYNGDSFSLFDEGLKRIPEKDNNVYPMVIVAPGGRPLLINALSAGGNSYPDKVLPVWSLNDKFKNLQGSYCAATDTEGNLWFGGIHGLYYLPLGGTEPVIIKSNPNDRNSLSADVVLSICISHEGLVWIGTSNGGVDIYDPKTSLFKNITDKKSARFHLNNKYIFGLGEDMKHRLWVGSMDGLHRLDFDAEKPDSYFDNISGITLFRNVGGANSLSENRISKIMVSGDSLFLGTMGGGLDIYDQAQNKFFSFKADGKEGNPLKTNFIQGIAEDRAGQIWICTKYGPLVWDAKAKTLKAKPGFDDPAIFKENYVSFHDSKGLYWFGNGDGLVKCEPGGKKTVYQHKENDTASLSYNTIGAIFEDSHHRLWIGTLGGGLNLYDRDKDRFMAYTEKDGLPNNSIFGILEDKAGNLWLSTNKGIAAFNPETHHSRNFDRNDGLAFSEFAQHSYIKAHNGWMFFGGEDGVIGFDPEKVLHSVYNTPIRLLDVKINYRSVGAGINGVPLSDLRDIDLNYEQKVVSFEFGVLNYLDANKVRYAYKLEGFDNDWHYTDSRQRFATYTNLPYNHYIFMVKATDATGTWMLPLKIGVRSVPPFWLTWWFITLVAAAALLIIIYAVRFFSRLRLQRRLQVLETSQKIQNERARIARELHDNVGSQLTYIISRLDQTRQKKVALQNPDELGKSIENIGLYARDTMQQLRESIWAMNKDSFTLGEFEMRLMEYMNRQLEGSEITWKIGRDGNEDDTALSPGIVINLFRIIQEAINNTLKHAQASVINIELKAGAKELTVIIADNGKGMDTDKESADMHYGLANMKSRAGEMQGALKLSSEPGKGTMITITLPIS